MWSATRMTLKYSVFWTNLLFFVFNCSSDKFGNLMYLKVMLFFAVVLHWMFTFLLYWCNYFYRKESHHEIAYRLIVRSPVLVWLCFFNLSLIVLIFFFSLWWLSHWVLWTASQLKTWREKWFIEWKNDCSAVIKFGWQFNSLWCFIFTNLWEPISLKGKNIVYTLKQILKNYKYIIYYIFIECFP